MRGAPNFSGCRTCRLCDGCAFRATLCLLWLPWCLSPSYSPAARPTADARKSRCPMLFAFRPATRLPAMTGGQIVSALRLRFLLESWTVDDLDLPVVNPDEPLRA